MIQQALSSGRKFKTPVQIDTLRQFEGKEKLRKIRRDRTVCEQGLPDPDLLSSDPYARSRQLLLAQLSIKPPGR